MNRAQKIIQPLIDAARDKYNKTPEGGIDYDYEDMASAVLLTLEEASAALATIADDIAIADVPAVEWIGEKNDYSHKWTTPQSSLWEIFELDAGTKNRRCDAVSEQQHINQSFHTIDEARRYVEIKLHLAALERKLLAELAGGK